MRHLDECLNTVTAHLGRPPLRVHPPLTGLTTLTSSSSIFVGDETKLTLHGLQQHYAKGPN
jgi:hypothetical protein